MQLDDRWLDVLALIWRSTHPEVEVVRRKLVLGASIAPPGYSQLNDDPGDDGKDTNDHHTRQASLVDPTKDSQNSHKNKNDDDNNECCKLIRHCSLSWTKFLLIDSHLY